MFNAGDRVLITGDHPFAGQIGSVSDYKTVYCVQDIGLVVHLDNGGGAFVFDKCQAVNLSAHGVESPFDEELAAWAVEAAAIIKDRLRNLSYLEDLDNEGAVIKFDDGRN